jgi:hypothetical protein
VDLRAAHVDDIPENWSKCLTILTVTLNMTPVAFSSESVDAPFGGSLVWPQKLRFLGSFGEPNATRSTGRGFEERLGSSTGGRGFSFDRRVGVVGGDSLAVVASVDD